MAEKDFDLETLVERLRNGGNIPDLIKFGVDPDLMEQAKEIVKADPNYRKNAKHFTPGEGAELTTGFRPRGIQGHGTEPIKRIKLPAIPITTDESESLNIDGGHPQSQPWASTGPRKKDLEALEECIATYLMKTYRTEKNLKNLSRHDFFTIPDKLPKGIKVIIGDNGLRGKIPTMIEKITSELYNDTTLFGLPEGLEGEWEDVITTKRVLSPIPKDLKPGFFKRNSITIAAALATIGIGGYFLSTNPNLLQPSPKPTQEIIQVTSPKLEDVLEEIASPDQESMVLALGMDPNLGYEAKETIILEETKTAEEDLRMIQYDGKKLTLKPDQRGLGLLVYVTIAGIDEEIWTKSLEEQKILIKEVEIDLATGDYTDINMSLAQKTLIGFIQDNAGKGKNSVHNADTLALMSPDKNIVWAGAELTYEIDLLVTGERISSLDDISSLEYFFTADTTPEEIAQTYNKTDAIGLEEIRKHIADTDKSNRLESAVALYNESSDIRDSETYMTVTEIANLYSLSPKEIREENIATGGMNRCEAICEAREARVNWAKENQYSISLENMAENLGVTEGTVKKYLRD
tara:strand:- start:6416 stop:8143 length:1728 start_codon:yes stop_codon:yes gene_type:complete